MSKSSLPPRPDNTQARQRKKDGSLRICLLVIFNHRFDANIPVLRRLYGDRFSNIRFAVPGYDGSDRFVVPFYNSSLCFQGAFPPAYAKFKDFDFSHYVIIGDDLVLNPHLNEETLLDAVRLKEEQAFITELVPLSHKGLGWAPLYNAIQSLETPLNIKTLFDSDLLGALPPEEDALLRIESSLKFEHLTLRSAKMHTQFSTLRSVHHFLDLLIIRRLISSLPRGRRIIDYPLLAGYSDLLIIPDSVMMEFCRYCGLFAIKNSHAEVAVPTALALATDRILTIGQTGYRRGDFWGSDIKKLETRCSLSISRLWEIVGKDRLYVHPVKLSRWTV